MAFLENSLVIFLMFITILFLIFIYTQHRNPKTLIYTNWPIVGIIPGFLGHIHRLHDFSNDGMIENGGTLRVRVPLFINLDMVVTVDPSDFQYILSKNFSNYPKGDKYFKIFAILGDGILNSDGKLWEIHRKVAMSILKNAGFLSLMETVTCNKVENELLPLLESICEHGTEVDLQEIFRRFSFDAICKVFFDNDLKSLSLEFPNIPCLEALIDAEEAIFQRHFMPPYLWKLLKLLRVGKEKKLSDGWKTLDEFIYKCLAQNQSENSNVNSSQHQERKFKFYTALVSELEVHEIGNFRDQTKFLRDTLFNMLVAGKDTTTIALSWFFYNIAKNPNVEDKILEEIHTHLKGKVGERWNTEELGQMVYLHGALCESLRLFPPVPFNHRSPLQPDILPSGHKVDQNTKIIISMYSMGRMKSIWGDDCLEFKPQRWVTKSGGIKHEPSNKFTTFGAGPRTCVGKNMSLSQLKIVSTAIIYHYHIELVEDHPVHPSASMVLHMKHGLKVRLTKRNENIN